MMVSPQSYAGSLEGEPLSRLAAERMRLVREISRLEGKLADPGPEGMVTEPGPDVRYQVCLECLAELSYLTAERARRVANCEGGTTFADELAAAGRRRRGKARLARPPR